MTVGEKLASRENAVTLLRLGFALLVVFGHSWELGGFGPDPLQRATGVTFGEVGLNSFFALSGYLVTQSWLRSHSGWDYLWRRVLRIFPGFWVCLLVTGLALFPFLWAQSHGTTWRGAFSRADFFSYVWRNALLRIRQGSIGDLFATQPASGVLNGSLWSLFPEFLCYLGVAFAGLCGGFATQRIRYVWLAALGLFALHALGPELLSFLSGRSHDRAWYFWRLATQGTFFSFGALCLVNARFLRVSYAILLAELVILAAAMRFGFYGFLGPLLLPLTLLQAAALFRCAWLDRIGDYSYGVYIYHYPLQQTLLFLGWGLAGAASFFELTVAAVLPVAILSWHVVEKPSLRLKGGLRAQGGIRLDRGAQSGHGVAKDN